MEALNPEHGLDWALLRSLVLAWYKSKTFYQAQSRYWAIEDLLPQHGVPSSEVQSYIRLILQGEAERVSRLFTVPQLVQPKPDFKPTHTLELHVENPGYVVRLPVMYHEVTRGLFTRSEWTKEVGPAEFVWMAGHVFLHGVPATDYYVRTVVTPLA